MNEEVAIKRGDIVHVINPVHRGGRTHMMMGNHFGVVLSNNKGNEHGETVIVAYITSNTRRLDLPVNCLLQWYDCFDKPSVILASQIVTVDKQDISAVIGHLRPEDEIRLNMALKSSMALED